MRCLMASLAIWLTLSAASEAASIKFCFLFCAVEADVTDGFCQNYERVIRSPSDSAEVRKMKGDTLKRTARNDTLYRCTCEGWKNPICGSMSR